jgi:hypothetical protein
MHGRCHVCSASLYFGFVSNLLGLGRVLAAGGGGGEMMWSEGGGAGGGGGVARGLQALR